MNGASGRYTILPHLLCLTALGAGSTNGESSGSERMAPIEIAERLVALETGVASSEGGERVWLFLETLLERRCGAETEPSSHRDRVVSGLWPGQEDSEIILVARCGTVAESNRAANVVADCGLAAAVGCGLADSPRNHPLRAVFLEAEEDQAQKAEAWIEQSAEYRRRNIEAVVSVERVGLRGADVGVLHPVSGERDGRWRITPVWLVHAALEGARAAGWSMVVADSRWPIFAQLGLRVSRSTRNLASRSIVEAEIPSVAISDVSLTGNFDSRSEVDEGMQLIDGTRLDQWTDALSAMIVHIDHAGQDAFSDNEYLVAFGRIWIRRDLLWLGFVLWVPMVFRGLPGNWRGTSSASRRRRGRDYLPGFAFRMLFLLSMFLIPTLATVLLYPVAILALIPPPRRASRRYWVGGLALLPFFAFTVWLSLAKIGGYLTFHRGALLPAALILLSLSTFWIWRVDQRPFHFA